jgi:hypothetical protein
MHIKYQDDFEFNKLNQLFELVWKLQHRKYLKKNLIYLFVGIILIIFGLSIDYEVSTKYAIDDSGINHNFYSERYNVTQYNYHIFLGLGIVLTLRMIYILYSVFRLKRFFRLESLRHLQKYPDSTIIQSYEITNSHVIIQNQLENSKYQWDFFSCYKEFGNYLLIFQNNFINSNFIYFDKSKLSVEEFKSIKTFLKMNLVELK